MYQSPFHILNETEINQAFLEDKEALRRLRKKLLADFNLQQVNELQLGSRTYSKDDILKAIDTLMENVDYELHHFIFSNKALLTFLESENPEYKKEDFKDLIIPESIQAKFHPLFAGAFCYALRQALKQSNFHIARELMLVFPSWLNDESDLLFESLYSYIEELGNEISEISETDINSTAARLPFLMKYELALFLNALPEELNEHKDDLIVSIINVLVTYTRLETCDGLYAYKVSVVLTNVNCRPDLMDLIKRNHAFFTARRMKNSERSIAGRVETKDNVPQALYILIVFVVILLVGLNTNKNSGRSNYSFSSNSIADVSDQLKSSIALLPNVQYFNFGLFHDFYTSKKKEKDYPADMRLLEIYEIDARNSPFKILTQAKPENMVTKEEIQKVLIENKSGFNLIVFSMDSLLNWSKYFANNDTGTLKYLPTQRLYFYFGDSLMTCNSCAATNDFFIKPENENHFAVFPDSAREIFSRKYHIVSSAKKSSTKTFAMPKLIITPSFFRKDSVVGKKVSLKRM